MKISAAALPFLILAGALGPLANGAPAHGIMMGKLDHPLVGHGGVHRATDCCPSYTPRNIRCVFMDSYYETSSGCPQPAVIFLTKRGQKVCTDPINERVQECVMKLDPENILDKRLVEEELQ
ncbi:C-C motif chemokine 15-like [Phyllostomus discolor]|uniref:C-C motif chemokine 15-like n=1 Tax=Phyllostomus discolor TaxID=89673 RepID=A0A6J2MG59_9CHIR|nr:C-C motif chemokine 15-like [Phyllostomus discolor]